jgi:hypothetical protein
MTALRNGSGRMAHFSYADFGGMSQWSPGMSMVGDMFNTELKFKLDELCTDIATHLGAEEAAGGGVNSRPEEVSYRSKSSSSDWWPSGLGLFERKTISATQSPLRPIGVIWHRVPTPIGKLSY